MEWEGLSPPIPPPPSLTLRFSERSYSCFFCRALNFTKMHMPRYFVKSTRTGSCIHSVLRLFSPLICKRDFSEVFPQRVSLQNSWVLLYE